MSGASFHSEMNQMQIRSALWGVMAVNLLVLILKIAVAVMTGSTAALAEVVFSILHAAATVISLVGLHVADEPPDELHPYGHYRVESLAALAVGVLTAVGLIELLRAMWGTLFGDNPDPQIDATAVVLLLITIAINLASCVYGARYRRDADSPLLDADSNRNLTDTINVSIVLLSFAVVQFGWVWVDVLVAGYVGYSVARTALAIVRKNAEVLVDTARLNPDHVRAIAMGVPGVRNAYAIRSRGAPGRVSLDLSIQVDPEVTVAAAHLLTHRVQDTLEAHLPELVDVVVHTEPGDD